MTGKKSITIFGATGSVGGSTLSLIREHPDSFTPHALTAHRDYQGLAKLALEFKPAHAVIADEAFYTPLSEALAGTGIRVAAGAQALIDIAAQKVDLIVAAIVGVAGLAPVWKAVEAGQTIALANKEALVSAGHLIMPAARKSGANLLPIDSEHNAIFQCLRHESHEHIERIILTASGGPFREMTLAEMQQVTIEQALQHPNWSMGPKITIDSATMMNKGLELIEAAWLFDEGAKKLDAIIHPQSTLHGLVGFKDGSWLAHLGIADMRVPISYALGWPERLAWQAQPLDFSSALTLDFAPVDETKFPCFQLAKQVMAGVPEQAIILNAANEVAVAKFLNGDIGFCDIAGHVRATLEAGDYGIIADSFEAILALDREIRQR
ncbi:MAG: 1-deoxy-D-xylulose-5-phosphate reductoisomerase [Alphaproteobacteria bacterium]|nr:1-deoxy-D-xylulose-5-phosphate reductoisomerase [Alphaproteobacteria bacterium]